MPPKKKKEKPVKAVHPMESDAKKAEPLTELDKEFYLIQIRDQEARVAKYQRRLDELEVQKNESEESRMRLSKEMEDIVSFLKKCLDQRADEIADLNDKLVALDQAKDAEKDAYEVQLSHLRHECQDAKDQLTTENIALAGKLAAVEEFRLQKEQLMANFADLEEEIKRMDHDHKGTVYDLERRAVIDKDRLKKDMITRLNTVATEFRRVSKAQMAQTTKRTIRENVSISMQLGKMSDKSLMLIKQNDDLRKAAKKQWIHLQILEENEHILIQKNNSNKKVIKMLTEKCKEQQALVNNYKIEEEEYQKQKIIVKQLQEQNESLSLDVCCLKRELMWAQVNLESKLKLLAEETECRKNVQLVLSDAAYTLKDILLSDDEPPETDRESVSISEAPVAAAEEPTSGASTTTLSLEKLITSSVEQLIVNTTEQLISAAAEHLATSTAEQPTPAAEQPVAVADAASDAAIRAAPSAETPRAAPVDETKLDSRRPSRPQRSQMMEKLLLILNTAACIGLGPPLRDFIKPEKKASVVIQPGNIQRRCVQMCPETLSRGAGIQSHYKQGDLGLVPRAKQPMPSIYDKVGFLSRTTRLDLIRTLPKVNCNMHKGSHVSEQGGK